jgi:ubiquinone biosynthesis protein UbiJ
MSGKYTVSLRAPFTSSWRKTQHASLAIALGGAWRKHRNNFSVDSITQEQKVVINSEELAQAFAQMDNLAHDQPKRPLHEIAEQVIQEIGKAEADQEP